MNTLTQLLVYPDKEVQRYVLQCLFFFSDLDDFARFDVFKAMNFIPKIVKFIEYEDSSMALTALKIAGNLTHGHSQILMVNKSSAGT